MKKLLVALVLSAATLASASVTANQLGQCLVDSLNGKERKELAKWIYFSMAAHPDITDFSNITPADRESTDKAIGALVTRLLGEDCPTQFKAAMAVDPMATQRAFELVGQVAMGELMQNEAVTRSISNYANHMDLSVIQAAAAQ
ncbi:hypothetical protein [Aestuariibacter sp. A3R04]|uniref:hypothetical protein n=1 Tax=Aestuariibacter sp. A3R04 TaxID=2841571 RepID=UPI001C0A4F0D|nr:hypothetical protein [Aestuariibacter sp. A3R04]MBU3020368.1 hypothetical protein [Aestuariibacter sp. A3R04]